MSKFYLKDENGKKMYPKPRRSGATGFGSVFQMIPCGRCGDSVEIEMTHIFRTVVGEATCGCGMYIKVSYTA